MSIQPVAEYDLQLGRAWMELICTQEFAGELIGGSGLQKHENYV